MQISYHSRFKRCCIRLLGSIGYLLYLITGGWRSKDKRGGPVRRILIIELWGIGDLVMMSTILKSLKNKYPEAEITLLSKRTACDIFPRKLYIDHFISFDFPWTKFYGKYKLWAWNWKGIFDTVKEIKANNFDLILDARGDIRNNFLTYFSRAKRSVGYDWLGGGYFLTDKVVLQNKNIHRIEAWKSLLAYLGIDSGGARPFLFVNEEEDRCAQELLKSHGINEGERVIGVHPGARNQARRWPLEQFERLMDYLGRRYRAKIIVFISPDGYGEDLILKDNAVKMKLPLREFIAVMKRIDLLICNDGGAMHIATALEKPLVTVFGPTNPLWFSPYGDNNTVIIKEKVKCRPCFDYCRYREPFCITTISFGEVVQKIDNELVQIFPSRIPS